MKFIHQLYLRRVTAPEQLSEAERAQLAARPELREAVDGQRALASLQGAVPPAPSRKAMLAQVYERAAASKEKPMTLFSRMFAGRPWYVRLAFACLMLLALLALGLLLPSRNHPQPGPAPAYAATDGYMLIYDFGAEKLEDVQPTLDQLKQTVSQFKQEHGLQQEDATWQSRVGVIAKQVQSSSNTNHGAAGGAQPDQAAPSLCMGGEADRIVCFVTLEDSALLKELSERLKSIPGLPEPQIVASTWFAAQGLPLPGEDGIRIALGLNGKQHMFTFPATATEAEMEQAINDWLAANAPEIHYSVDVKVTEQDGKKEVRVEIRGDGQQASAAAGAPEATGKELTLKLNVNGEDKVFSYPAGTAPATIKADIEAWLAQQYPGKHFSVDVQTADVDGQPTLQVKVVTQE